jgi:Flp pilus assembly protein TadG
MRLRRARTRSAATVVEAAFVISLVLLFMFGIFEYCRFIFLVQVCENAAREGARFAVARTADGTTLADVQNFTTYKMSGRDSELAGYTVTVQNVNPATGNPIPNANWNDAPFGGAIMVRVSGTYSPMLPSFLQTQTSIQINSTSMMTSEAN